MHNDNQQYLIPTYARQPIAFERGEGVWLYSQTGERYLDAISGIGVCNLGHAHPAVTRALQQQAGTLMHTSNLYRIPVQEDLAAKLCAISGMEKVFFSNSGAEANEAAIKIARLYGHQRHIQQPKIIVMDNSFHGRTMAALSATGNRKAQEGFGPLVEGFLRVPFNDLDAIAAYSQQDDVVAVFVEPVQGEGGIRIPDAGYLSQLRALCDANNWLLMLDEVQSGNGRTGAYFAYMHERIVPDVVTTAKGLGNGFPIGACLVAANASPVFGPGSHGSTYGGNPLGCAAALAVVNTIEQQILPQLPATIRTLGTLLCDRLGALPGVVDIRQKGLMIGIELDRPCAELVAHARDAGALINVTAGNVVRLLPPLVISENECRILVDTLSTVIEHFLIAEPA